MTDDTTRSVRPASGRFVLRIDPALHASLRQAARARDVSLNRYCAVKLATPVAGHDPAAAEVLVRSQSILGDTLLGVVAFGSWARGESVADSDLDVLVIADDQVAITRDLYRRWDAQPPIRWNGRRVEPHFCNLPPDHAEVSGLWAEVSIDGTVLFDRRLVVSRRLVRNRRRILEGHMSARVVHGQPYWVRER